jgi:hypothetical protein
LELSQAYTYTNQNPAAIAAGETEPVDTYV